MSIRLLKLEEHGTFSLTEFAGNVIPPYAILSHTWGTDGEEVIFEDVENNTYRTKTGYEKLGFCAKQATINNLDYFWVDTCCINKANPVELQHAINSMFRWYREAVRCYVYLSDVQSVGDDESSQVSCQAAFQTSRWFTRGWTLQELLAPNSVEFFTTNHIRIGDKKSLEQQIREITRIPISALRGTPLSDFTVEERISWAENRKTKYEEDKVYSLQGLFDIHIPLIYGEGWKRALTRLQKEIRELSQPPVIFPNGNVSWIVPFDRNPNFTGRELQLAELEGKLFVEGQPTRYAVTGLGGVGKTQLVLELIYRVKDKHKNCSVIWIPATNMENLHQAYQDTAQQLGIAGWEDDKLDVKRLVQDHLSKENTGQWLLVFDNADDINMWITKSGSEAGCSRLIDYLPRSKQGQIVFTSRDRKTAVELARHNVIEVGEMSEDMAIQLLQRSLINPNLVNNEPETKALLKELTYLPLAIVQAVAYVNKNGISFAEYRSLLAEQEVDVVELLSEEFEDDGRYHDIKNPVATTWLVSFKQIRDRDHLAADYLSFMACIDPKDIPQSLLPAGTSRKKEVEAIGTLEAYSFIVKRPADLAVDLHRLVHLATRNWLRIEQLISQWTEKAITRLEEVFPDNDHKNRRVWRTYLPHVRYTLMSDVEQNSRSRINLAWRFGMCLFNDGHYNEAETQFVGAFNRDKSVLGQEDPSTLASMANLAITYRNQGRWKEAEELHVQVMETRTRVLGQEHPDTLTSMANLASTYWNQGRWKEGEDLFVLVIEIRKRVLGQEHPNTLTSMANLASTYGNQGRWKEAEELEVQVIETSKEVLGQEHPNTLTSMANLASTYGNQGRWKEAEELEVQVIETSKEVLGQEHPDTLTSMANLASTYGNQGRWKEAEELEVHVIETRKRVIGQEHPNTLTSIANLASIYWNQGRWKEAEELEVHAMETRKRVLGKEHPDTLNSMANLASTYMNQGRWKEGEDLLLLVIETRKRGRWREAEELEVQVIETRKRVLGQEHPSTLASMANLALTYRNQGRWKEAEELDVQVIETRKRVLGQEHPDTLTSMANLASTYRNQGRLKEAEELEIHTIETRKRVLGKEHPDTLTSIANLASTYWDQGRWKEAEELEIHTMETRKMVLGQEHPDTLTNMANLAFIWKRHGRDVDALELMKQCVEVQARILGSNHPDTLSSLTTLLSWEAEKPEVVT